MDGSGLRTEAAWACLVFRPSANPIARPRVLVLTSLWFRFGGFIGGDSARRGLRPDSSTPGGMELRAQVVPPLKWPGKPRIGPPRGPAHGVLARLQRLRRLRLEPWVRSLSGPNTRMPRGLCPGASVNTPGGMELRAQVVPPLKWPGKPRIGPPRGPAHGVLARLQRLRRLRLEPWVRSLSGPNTRMPRGLCPGASVNTPGGIRTHDLCLRRAALGAHGR